MQLRADGSAEVHCAAAEVDVDLGLTRIVWIGAALDVGKAINPQAVEGQIEGGTAQGLGLALMEEIQTRDGLITNASFTDYLIPTALKLDPTEGVTPGTLEYPAGKEYSFSFDPKEKLDVYSGDFTVKVPLVAAAGEHTVLGTLRYQACDNAACYPPRQERNVLWAI